MTDAKWKQVMTIRKLSIWWLLAAATATLMLSGCNESKHKEIPMATATQQAMPEWQALKQKRVVFGHQSVGRNILNGVEHLAARDGVKFDINKQRTAPTVNGISHFTIGENGDPMSKIRDFSAAIDAGAAEGADIALMKFCYVDFNATSNAKQLADDYIANLESLAQRHPGTIFAAVTAPLLAVQTGPKAWLKRLMGKQPSGYLDNAKRMEFNTALRERYRGADRLFDLAKAETESADKSCMADVDGQAVETLCPELTSDGGHLNERGQELVATAFLNFISSLPSKQVAN